MLNIQTTRFGEIEVETDKIIYFSQGIPGFEAEKEFVIIPYDEKSPFLFLQSVKTEDLAFLLANPFQFFTDYNFELDDIFVEELALKSEEDILVYTILTMHGANVQEITANLLAPIVINQQNKMAKQIVLENSKYTTRHKIFAKQTDNVPEGGK